MTAFIYSDFDSVKQLSNIAHSKIKFFDWAEKQNFLNNKCDIKIAIFQPDYQNIQNFKQLCTDLRNCDLVIVYSMELTDAIFTIMKKFDQKNFVFIIDGVLNKKLLSAKVISNNYWLRSTAYLYQFDLKNHHHDSLNPFVNKSYKFDVLYGRPRLHRDFVKKSLELFNNLSWFYESPYFGQYGIQPDIKKAHNLDKNEFWEDDIVPSTTNDSTCTYHGVQMQLCQVMPYKIYNQTLYSLVCETSYHNDFSFFTEKIVKPILSYRLFVIISGQYYLKNLRSLGFKTFNCVIDESYDEIEDDQQRWSQALSQAVWLCSQDFNMIIKKITPILLHNYDMISRLENTQLDQELESFLIINGYHK
jgi:hypothetical protein